MPEQIIEESDNIHDSGEHLVRIQKTYSVANDDEAAEIIHEGNFKPIHPCPKVRLDAGRNRQKGPAIKADVR